MKTKLLSLILALTMLVPLAACSNESPQDTETTGAVESTSIQETTAEITPAVTNRADAKDSLPADLKLNGETIRIQARNMAVVLDYDVVGKDNSGDIVYDAIWERNEKVKERLDVNLDIIPTQSATLSEQKAEMQALVMSGSDDYDMFWTTNTVNVQFGLNAYLRVLNDAPYLDYDAPWWWKESMQNIALDGETIQFLIGDMMFCNILRAGAVFVNKELWQDNFGDPEQIYTMVEDGKWTLDTLGEYSKKVFKDVNGDGKADAGDTVGFYANENQSIAFLRTGSDIFMTGRDDNGYTVWKAPTERSATFVEKMINLYYNENTAMIAKGGDETQQIPAFVEGRCLFMPRYLRAVVQAELRDMEADYAIIPMPKLDEEQADYRTLIEESSTNVTIPITVNDKKFASVCATLEALCAESYRSVTEKFFEIALKGKYSRDSASSRMIDMIIETACVELATQYAASTNNMYNIYQKSISAKDMVIVSYYESRLGAAQAGLDKLIAELKKIK